MNPDDFSTSTVGRVIRVGQGKSAYWAFVPNPLPPPLTFDPVLIRWLSEADRALGELAGLGRALPNPHLLISPFIRREAALSSRIEGTQADLADLYAFEAGLFAVPVLTPGQVVRQFKVSHPAAMQALRRLEQDQILKEISGKQRHRLYVAIEILRALE